jgi:PIN domain nuclease of toxin-antitoxin system
VLGAILGQGFRPLDISTIHAQRAGSLPGHHQDPWDRMLIAQAQAEGLALVTNESLFDEYGISRVW